MTLLAGWILFVLVALPLVAAALLAFAPPPRAREASLAFAVLQAALAVALAVSVGYAGAASYARGISPRFGLSFALAAEGFAAALLLLNAATLLAAVFAAWEVEEAPGLHHSLLHATAAGTAGVFAADNLLCLYFFWELALIPMFLLILRWGSDAEGGARRRRAAYSFLVYTVVGSLPMLLAIVAMRDGMPTGTWRFPWDLGPSISAETLLFLAFLLAFAVKLPLWPLHSWLPDAHTEAPTSASILLAAVLLKMGGWGLFRWAAPIFPAAFAAFSPILLVFGLAGIWIGAWMAWRSEDAKRIIAYSSVSHMGFVAMGLASGAASGARGAAFVLIGHGITSAALFFWFGVLYERRHTRRLSDWGGLASLAPGLSAFAATAAFAGVAVPGTVGFVGEFLVLSGLAERSPLFAGLAASGAVFAAAYTLRLLAEVLYGEAPSETAAAWRPPVLRETLVAFAFAAAAVGFGLAPKPVLSAVGARADEAAARLRAGLVEVGAGPTQGSGR